MSPRAAIKRVLWCAGVLSATALTSLPATADDNAPRKDEWRFMTQGPFGLSSGGSRNSFYFQATPGTAFSSFNGTRGFVDYSMAHALSFGRDLGIGDLQATFGLRVSEPLIRNGFTPAFDDRRYTGTGPRIGLQGNNRVQSWSLDWQVGAAMLYNDKTPETGSPNPAIPIPNYAASNGSTVSVDGLLGLSYWFSSASKLTLGYRADAYFNKNAPAINFNAPTQTIDHGPMVKFTIQ